MLRLLALGSAGLTWAGSAHTAYAEPFKNSKEALCKTEVEKKAKEIIRDIMKAVEKNTGQPIPAVEKEQYIKDYVARQVQMGECGSPVNGLV